MSVDTNIYLGPYARFPYTPKTHAVPVQRCSNVTCTRHVDKYANYNSYCSDCGAPVTKQFRTSDPQSPDVNSLLDRKERVVELHVDPKNNILYVCSNLVGSKLDRSFMLDFTDDYIKGPVPITPEVIEREKANFEKEFEEELSTLGKELGSPAEIMWGYHMYHS